MDTDPLVTFLNARLDEDEAAAKAAQSPSPWKAANHPVESRIIVDADGEAVVYNEGVPSLEEAAHIARHDPGRVLREVAAKRAIIAEHIHMNGGSCLICHYQVGPQLRPAPWPCPTIRALAAIWSDHPGHREEWRPSR